jgi:predicted transcriptional regulator YdeE
MDAKIVQRADAHILGIQVRINPMSANYEAIWRDQYDPRHPEVLALSGQADCYGAYYASGEPDMADFVAGMIVPADTVAPAGLVLRSLPGGAYARFDCTLGELPATWGAIYSQWLPGSRYAEDASRPCFEVYDLVSMGPLAPVQVYVAVKDK